MTFDVAPFHDPRSGTITYVVSESTASACAVIDPVLGSDPASGTIDTQPLGPVIDHVHRHRLSVQWILERTCMPTTYPAPGICSEWSAARPGSGAA